MLLQSSQDNPQSQLTLTVPAEHGSLPSFSSPKLSKIIWCEPIFSHNLIPVPTLFHEKSVFETRPCYWPPPSFFTREIPELGQTGGIDVFHSLLLRIFFSFIWSWLETVSLSDVWHSYWKILFSSRANWHWMLDNIRRRQATLLAENCIRRSRSDPGYDWVYFTSVYKRASLPVRGWWSARQTDDSHINRGVRIENKNRVSQVMLHSKRPG